MFANGRQRCLCCRSSSNSSIHPLQTRPRPRSLIHTSTQASRFAPDSTTLLPPYPRDRSLPSRAEADPASFVLAARHILKSRGRNLRLGRSSLFTPTATASPTRFSPLYTLQTRAFSRSPFAMTATKIDGTAIAKSIRERLHAEIEATQKANPRFKPSLKIIQGIFHLTSGRIYIYSDVQL